MDPNSDHPNETLTFYDQLARAMPTPEIQVVMGDQVIPFPAGLVEEVGQIGAWSLVWAWDQANMGNMPCKRFQPRLGMKPGSENGYSVKVGYEQFQDFYSSGYVEVFFGQFYTSDPDANERAPVKVSSHPKCYVKTALFSDAPRTGF